MKMRHWIDITDNLFQVTEAQSVFRMPIAEIIMDSRSVVIVMRDLAAGKLSHSGGQPVALRTATNGLELADGYHRVLRALLAGRKSVRACLDGRYATEFEIPTVRVWAPDLADIVGSFDAIGIRREEVEEARRKSVETSILSNRT